MKKKTLKPNKVYSAWLPNVSHDTIHKPLEKNSLRFFNMAVTNIKMKIVIIGTVNPYGGGLAS